jgi:hypothetical protein
MLKGWAASFEQRRATERKARRPLHSEVDDDDASRRLVVYLIVAASSGPVVGSWKGKLYRRTFIFPAYSLSPLDLFDDEGVQHWIRSPPTAYPFPPLRLLPSTLQI